MSSQTFSTFSEVGMIDARSQNGTITLPLTTDIPYRILTLKDIYGASALSSITLTTQGADVFEDGTTSRLLNGAFETTTLYAGQAGFWYVTGGSRLATAAIGTLSTGLIQNPLRLGTLSTQTAIQFPGLRSNYTGTVVAGQTTGVGTQELLLYQASSISDQIRLQTTGNIVFEAGAGSRSWPSTAALVTPTLYIAGSTSNVGIGTATPATTLDVVGTGRFQTLSTVSLNVSSINGIIPGAAFIGSTNFISATTVQALTISAQSINVSSVNGILPGAAFNGSTLALSTASIRTSSLTASQITTSNLVLNGTETINFNGGVGAAGYGEGIDTLSLKSPLTAYNGGIASLFFGNGTTAYPLARIAAVDSATEAPGASALVFQTATAAINASLSGINIFTATGADQTYTVPTGVTSIVVSMWSGGGGGSGSTGGAGVYVKGVMAVTPGQTLKVVVGGAGRYNTLVPTYGGGGAGGANIAASGGGRSALQTQVVTVVTGASSSGTAFTYTTSTAHNLAAGYGVAISGLVTPAYNINGLITGVTSNTFTIANTATPATITSQSGSIFLEILDAGGGGGSYNGGGGPAGNGGLTNGQAASTNNNNNSGGGSQTAGGQAGTSGGQGAGGVGSMFVGGNGGTGGNGGGGGGGGWFGGGGGNGVGSGGGGSSYTSYPAFTLSDSGFTANFSRSAPGTSDTYYQSGVAQGGAGGNDGGPGLIVIVASPTYAMGEAMRISRFGFVGVGTNNPSTLLDVAGSGRFQTLSTLSLNISTINGQTTSQLAAIPIQSTVVGLGTAGYVSSLRNVLLVSSQQINTSTLNSVYLSSAQGYISSFRTDSLTVGGPTGYVAIQDLTTGTISTGQIVAGAGFISSLQINTLSFGPSGYVIVGDVIANSLSTKRLNTQALYANNLYVGNTSTQSAILFPGVDGNFKGTAVAEQVTGVGTEELLLYKVSTTSDQIRLQTTGNIVFEAGASARSWPSTTALATPTLYIQGSTSNVGVGTAAPATTLDVVGTGRFQILSSYTLNVSSINGILPGAGFNGSTIGLSSATINTSSVNATQITTTNLTVNGTETINFNGGLGTDAYGSGVDTLSLKSPLGAYAGGIASLFFGNATNAYPLARIAAVDSAAVAPGASALVFQTATAAANASLSGVSIFSYTGVDQTYTVPSGVTSITISMWSGGGGSGQTGTAGASGYWINGILTVSAGQIFRVIVAQGGVYNSTATSYGGGGGAGSGGGGASGGGRSALQLQLTSVITSVSASGSVITYTTSSPHGLVNGYGVLISGINVTYNQNGIVTVISSTQFSIVNSASAGNISSLSGTIFLELLNVGGGGGSYQGSGDGPPGDGGLTNGGNGLAPYNGQGGTQTTGGSPGIYSVPNGEYGAFLRGGASVNHGGGGGGGWFGGGGGDNYGGGGGGSSYTSYPGFTLSQHGFPGNADTYYVSGLGAAGTGNGVNGGNGRVVIVGAPSFVMGEAMRISQFGYLGVGTAAPSTLLDVAGTARAQTVSTLNINLSTINGATVTQLVGAPIQSTVVGLGTAGYVSTQQLAATSNFFRNLLALNVSSAISTATLYTSNTSNYFLPALSNNLSSAASTLGLYTSNTSNYFQNVFAFNVSSAISTATLFTSNTSNFIFSTNQSSISTAFVTAVQGYISSLVVDSLAIGSNSGFINMGDLITTSLSTLQLNTGLLTGSELIVSSINGQQPLTLQNLTSTVTGTNSNISSMIDPTELTSTVTGLGTANFISSVGLTSILASTVTGVNTTITAMIDPVELTSSITGLGAAGFISSIGLDTRFASTTQGLIQGLGSAGYASTSYVLRQISSLSTAYGLITTGGAAFVGSTIFLSAATIQASNVSTFQITAQNINTQAVSTNALIFGTGTGTLLMPDIAPNTIYTSTVTTSNLQIGWTSNQSPLQFYGFGTYSNSVIVEQSTGTATQELFVFRGSNAADRIRFQTTGYMAIETGVSSRLYTAALSNAVPAVMIDINSNVGIRLAAPAHPLDVGGIARAVTLSSLTLQTSTIEGAIFTRDLYANARTLLQGEVSTPFLLGNYNTLTFRTAGTQRATFTQAGNLGIGVAAPQFPVDIAGITRVSTIYNSTSISYNFISAPLLVASTVNTENVQTTNISTNQINASLIYGRWNDAQYYVLQTL